MKKCVIFLLLLLDTTKAADYKNHDYGILMNQEDEQDRPSVLEKCFNNCAWSQQNLANAINEKTENYSDMMDKIAKDTCSGYFQMILGPFFWLLKLAPRLIRGVYSIAMALVFYLLITPSKTIKDVFKRNGAWFTGIFILGVLSFITHKCGYKHKEVQAHLEFFQEVMLMQFTTETFRALLLYKAANNAERNDPDYYKMTIAPDIKYSPGGRMVRSIYHFLEKCMEKTHAVTTFGKWFGTLLGFYLIISISQFLLFLANSKIPGEWRNENMSGACKLTFLQSMPCLFEMATWGLTAFIFPIENAHLGLIDIFNNGIVSPQVLTSFASWVLLFLFGIAGALLIKGFKILFHHASVLLSNPKNIVYPVVEIVIDANSVWCVNLDKIDHEDGMEDYNRQITTAWERYKSPQGCKRTLYSFYSAFVLLFTASIPMIISGIAYISTTGESKGPWKELGVFTSTLVIFFLHYMTIFQVYQKGVVDYRKLQNRNENPGFDANPWKYVKAKYFNKPYLWQFAFGFVNSAIALIYMIWIISNTLNLYGWYFPNTCDGNHGLPRANPDDMGNICNAFGEDFRFHASYFGENGFPPMTVLETLALFNQSRLTTYFTATLVAIVGFLQVFGFTRFNLSTPKTTWFFKLTKNIFVPDFSEVQPKGWTPQQLRAFLRDQHNGFGEYFNDNLEKFVKKENLNGDIISIIKIQESIDLDELRLKLSKMPEKIGNDKFEESLKKMIKNASKTSRNPTTRKFLKSYLGEWKGSWQIFKDWQNDGKDESRTAKDLQKMWEDIVDVAEKIGRKEQDNKYVDLKRTIESAYQTNSQLKKKLESDDPFRTLCEKVNEYSNKLETDDEQRKSRIRSRTIEDKKYD